jgi:hypothetical protein
VWLGTTDSLTQRLAFTSQNWNTWQNVTVIAWADGLFDGQDYKAFGRQLSLLSFIQGMLAVVKLTANDTRIPHYSHCCERTINIQQVPVATQWVHFSGPEQTRNSIMLNKSNTHLLTTPQVL